MKKLPADIFNGEVDHAVIKKCIERAGYNFYCLGRKDIHKLIQPRAPAGHKGTFGHALIVAGSEGKSGAALLAGKAALRTGCGLLTVAIPASAIASLLVFLPEAMPVGCNEVKTSAMDLSRFQSIGFGPGAGMAAGDTLLHLLDSAVQPMLIDADGITLLSQNQDWYAKLTPRILLTPHPGEFDRLTKKHASDFDRFRSQMDFSRKYQVNVLLKGRYTSITTPDGKLYFNTTGNNGMATAGSGDVLSGIITSLLAQRYPVSVAAVLGAYLHGYAGDSKAGEMSQTALIASDIIAGVAGFFLDFEK